VAVVAVPISMEIRLRGPQVDRAEAVAAGALAAQSQSLVEQAQAIKDLTEVLELARMPAAAAAVLEVKVLIQMGTRTPQETVELEPRQQ